MRYFNPKDVRSPRDFVEDVIVMHDGGSGEILSQNGFSLAKILWEGDYCYGIRWNVARREWDDPDKVSGLKICVGVPSSHGYPVWFILPEIIVKSILANPDILNDLTDIGV
ncbi:MAG: hypothetical protein Q8M15_16735 [Bacteroidota bacterium]|nr:hypothetical protein [Bacteroidota bacterium]